MGSWPSLILISLQLKNLSGNALAKFPTYVVTSFPRLIPKLLPCFRPNIQIRLTSCYNRPLGRPQREAGLDSTSRRQTLYLSGFGKSLTSWGKYWTSQKSVSTQYSTAIWEIVGYHRGLRPWAVLLTWWIQSWAQACSHFLMHYRRWVSYSASL